MGEVPNGATSPVTDSGHAFADDLAQAATEPEWVVDGVLPAGGLVIFAGLPKVARKTWIATHLGLCVSQALPFLGRRTTARRVVYSYLEDGKFRVAWRMRALGRGQPGQTKAPFVATYTEEAFWDYQARIAETADPILWIIDPLIELETLHNVESENDANTISRLIKGYRQIAHARRHTIVMLHHKRKDGLYMRGSGALNGASDGWWDLDPIRGTRGGVRIKTTLRDGVEQEIGFEIREDNRGGVQIDARKLSSEDFEEEGNSREPVKIGKTAQRVRDELRKDPNRIWKSQIEIADALGVERKAVGRAVQALIDIGQVVPPGGGSPGYRWKPAPREKPNGNHDDHVIGERPAGDDLP